ncbi:MAG: hypothetical protein ACK4F7_11785 [Inhella sp.]
MHLAEIGMPSVGTGFVELERPPPPGAGVEGTRLLFDMAFARNRWQRPLA